MKQLLARVIRCGVIAGALMFNSNLPATVITITNPGFVATINSNFTFNSVNYLAGAALPQGVYVNTLDGASTGNVKKISDDSQVAPGVTATVTGWLPVPTPGLLDHDRAGVSDFGSSDVANLVTYNSDVFNYHGVKVGFMQTLPGSIQLQPMYTYALNMTVASNTLNPSPTFFADLTVGGTPVGGTLVYNAPPLNGTGSATVTYVAGVTPPTGNLGIIFYATDTSGALTKLLIDNISLTETIPEPSMLLLLGFGGLLVLRRRKCGHMTIRK